MFLHNRHKSYHAVKVFSSRLIMPLRSRHEGVAEDKIHTMGTSEYMLEDSRGITHEYEGESKNQFFPYRSYIGCYGRHLSLVADHLTKLSDYEALSGSNSLYS